MNFDSINGTTDLEIELVELGLRLGEHNNSKRQGIPFLSPCAATISMRQTDPKMPARYKASIDSLYFNMTPTLYEVVMGVINTINMTGTEAIKKETKIQKLLEDSEPFVMYKIDSKQYENLKNKSNIKQSERELENEIHNLTIETVNSAKYNRKSTIGEKHLNMVNSAETILAEKSKEILEKVNKATRVLETLDLTIKEAFITFCEGYLN